MDAIKFHFQWVNDTLRRIEKMRLDAEPRHLDALLQFAARAYRRPLTKAERDDVLAYYHQLRDKGGLTHEEAIRDSLVSVLMSPDFCYRIDLLDSPAERSSVSKNCWGRAAAQHRVRAGQPLELFPLVQHARSGTTGTRGLGRPATN